MARGYPLTGYLTPNETPEERLCRSFSIPNSPEWLGAFMGACYVLTQEKAWREHGTLTPEECAAIAQIWFDDAFYGTSACNVLVPAPYWDDAADNEVELPETEQTWYGAVTDWLAPVDELNFEQNIALWALTGFVAYAGGVGSAIFFRTTAKRFIIAIEAGEIAEIIRIVVDAAEFNIDTTGLEGTIIEQEVITVPEVEEHDIYIIRGEFE